MSRLLEIVVDLHTVAFTFLCIIGLVWIGVGWYVAHDNGRVDPLLVIIALMLSLEIVLNTVPVVVILMRGSFAILNLLVGY